MLFVENNLLMVGAKRSYVMCPYTLVKDNDSGYENSNVNDILDGNIDDMIEYNIKFSK